MNAQEFTSSANAGGRLEGTVSESSVFKAPGEDAVEPGGGKCGDGYDMRLYNKSREVATQTE